MADTMQQNEQRSSPLESNPCHSEFQPDDIPSGNTNGHCNVNNDQGSNVSTTPQITPVKPIESCTKTTSGQNLTHAMPVVYPELSMISPFPGQTPVNALDTKLAGPLQSTMVTDSPSNLMESPTATSNAYSNTTISPFCLPTKLSYTEPSYNDQKSLSPTSIANSCGITDQTVPCAQLELNSADEKDEPIPLSITKTNSDQSTETIPSTNAPMCSTPGFAKDLHASSLKQATEINSAVTPATQCLYTSTDNGAQTTTTSITHKHPKQALVSGDSTQAKPSLTGSTALVVPQFQLGRVDAKKFPPRHYDIYSLEIGTWKYQRSIMSHGISRLKVIFTQRKFICELDLRANTTTQEGQTAPGNNHLVCIEIPFTTIVGINIPTAPSTATTVFIQVDTVPAMWQGTKILQQRSHGAAYARVQYDTSHTVDFTNGQLSKVPFYKITISSVGIRDHLMKFDPRFSVLMKIPIKIDSNMTPPAQKQLSKPAKRKRQTSQSLTSAVSQEHSGLQNDLESNQKYQRVVQTKDSLKTCACTSGCMSKRCNCIKEGRKCESDCRCVACNNPLNILAEFGVNLAEARHDICFMQNLSKISNLRAFLQDSVETPCCDSRIPLSNCCIGIVECPECESEYRYSWCSRGLCDEESRPRNHCAICQTCRDYRDQHCRRCNRCYFAGSSGFSCPCRGGSRHAMSMFGFMF